jgi:hypothetical protein
MFFTRLFQSAKPRSPGAARLSVEALDDRIVPAKLSVGDAVVAEGNAGTQYAMVHVTLDAPSNQTVSVNYATAGGTATVGGDYGSVSGTLTFARGETSKTITVPVYGDRLTEGNETFLVNLSGAQRAGIADGRGVVTIADDEPRLSISDAYGTVAYSWDRTVSGTMTFYVSLATAYDQEVTVSYATADGTAAAGVGYAAASGTLTFAPGETTKTITVQVLGTFSGGGVFYVNLGGASDSAQIVDGQGVGNIQYYVEQSPGDPGDGCGCDPDGPNICFC